MLHPPDLWVAVLADGKALKAERWSPEYRD